MHIKAKRPGTLKTLLFVNTKTGWIFSIKNTLENQKKLLTNQPIQNFKIKIVQ